MIYKILYFVWEKKSNNCKFTVGSKFYVGVQGKRMKNNRVIKCFKEQKDKSSVMRSEVLEKSTERNSRAFYSSGAMAL